MRLVIGLYTYKFKKQAKHTFHHAFLILKRCVPTTLQYAKKFFDNAPFFLDDSFYVAIVCPVVHYTMGGIALNTKAQVLTPAGKVIPGLFVTGEGL